MPTLTLQQQLDEARAAYHALMLGRSVVELRDSNGETITYTPANRNALSSYIKELERQLGQNTTCGPMGVYL